MGSDVRHPRVQNDMFDMIFTEGKGGVAMQLWITKGSIEFYPFSIVIQVLCIPGPLAQVPLESFLCPNRHHHIMIFSHGHGIGRYGIGIVAL